MGFFGGLARIFLVITNFLFLLIGIGVFAVAAIFRWNKDSFLNKILPNSDLIKPIINVLTLNTITIIILIIGSVIIVISLVGLCGALLGNRCILGVYLTIMILVLLAHAITIILLSIVWPEAQNTIRVALNKTVDDLNSPTLPPDQATLKCSGMRIISNVFECCGANGPEDFKLNTTYVNECCMNNFTNVGCSDKSISAIKGDMSIIIISNVGMIVFEFLIVVFAFISILSLRRNSQNLQKNSNKRMINMTPTTAIYVSGNR